MPHPSPLWAQPAAAPEVLLAVAVLRQAALDVRARRPQVRTEAEQFWENEAAVTLWAEVLDVDVQALRCAVLGARPPG
jgi:hypothetical protein